MEVKTHLREAAQREREITALANNPQVPCKLHTGSSDLDIHDCICDFQVLYNIVDYNATIFIAVDNYPQVYIYSKLHTGSSEDYI